MSPFIVQLTLAAVSIRRGLVGHGIGSTIRTKSGASKKLDGPDIHTRASDSCSGALGRTGAGAGRFQFTLARSIYPNMLLVPG